MNPWRYFKKTVEDIETQRFSLLFGSIGLFSIILVRNIFESSFEGSQTLGFSPISARSFYMMFSHFPLFYISLFLWFIVVFAFLTRESVIPISKAVLYGMWVIVITPFIDIVVSKGSGYKLTYLRGMEQFTEIYKFFDFSRDIIESSWGQRIEIVLALFGGFAYVLLKTKNIWKSLAAAVIFYLIIFLHGALPNTVSKFPFYFGYNDTRALTLLTGGFLPIDSQNYAIIFILSCLTAGLFLYKRLDKDALHKIFSFRTTIIPVILCSLGLIYGLLRLVHYYPALFLNPITYLAVITAIITVHLVLIAGQQKAQDKRILILLLFSIFSAVALGPVFLAGAILLYFLAGAARVRIICTILSIPLGFSVVFQNYAIISILPLNNGIDREYCRKVQAWNQFLDKKYGPALEEYEKAYLINQNQETKKRIGQCHLHLGNVRKGIKLLEEIQPPDYETIGSLADAYTMTGQVDSALAFYDLAVSRKIEPAEFLIKSARLYARTGQEAQTRTALERAVKYGAARHIYFEIMGDLHLAKKEFDIAKACLLEALRLNNRSVTAHSGLATVFYYRGNYKEAEKEFLKALKYDPADDALYNNLGAIYLITGDYQSAMAIFEKSIRINASQVEGYYNLGLAAEKTGDLNRAIAMYRKALSINAGFGPARQALERLGLTGD